MLIISKRAFRFVLRNDKKEVTQNVEVRPNIITTIPDWVKNDPLFKLADSDGLITYVEKPAPSVFVDNVPPETPQEPNALNKPTETPQEPNALNNRNNRNKQGS